MAVVQAIVGHSNPAMTRHYYHESEEALRGVISALPSMTGTIAPEDVEAATRAKVTGILREIESLTEEELSELAAGIKLKQKLLDRLVCDRPN